MFFQDPPKLRYTNTHKSNINFEPSQSTFDYKSTEIRQKRFEDKPLVSGATRQSYQDSDIFGTKSGSEIVQRSALVQKDIKQRNTNTFAASDVMGNNELAHKCTDGHIHNAQTVTRQHDKWQSNVFGDPIVEKSNRKKLGGDAQGKDAYFGSNGEKDQFSRKVNFAGTMSQKEVTREPQFDKTAADERLYREVYGNSKHQPPEKQPSGKPQTAPYNAAARKAEILQSKVLTHEDEGLRHERDQAYF